MEASISGGILHADKITEAATGYISLMRAHIKKENMVPSPMGNKMLPMNEQEHLLNQFEAFEEEVMGKGTHEKYHETLHRLERKHLKTRE